MLRAPVSKPNSGKKHWLLASVFAVLTLSTAAAQTPAASTAVPAKPSAFDVISIRQNLSQRRNGPPVFGPTADGYRMAGAPLLLPIITAYVPQAGAVAFMLNQIKGLPDWAMRDSYDIDAKVANEDLAEWQTPASQKKMLPAMMQALLEERCKLVVHRETKDDSVYLLTIGKSGPKFKETNPDEAHPAGIKLPWGGVMVPSADGVTLYGASMALAATLLGQMGNVGRPIQDATGLTGRYDFTMNRNDMQPPSSGDSGATGASDPGSIVFAIVEKFGLKLQPGKGPVETLVIDHIEKPSAN